MFQPRIYLQRRIIQMENKIRDTLSEHDRNINFPLCTLIKFAIRHHLPKIHAAHIKHS